MNSTSAVAMPRMVTAKRRRRDSLHSPRAERSLLSRADACDRGQKRQSVLMAPVVVFWTKWDSARAYALRLETDRRALMPHRLSSVASRRRDGSHYMMVARHPRGAMPKLSAAGSLAVGCNRWLASLLVRMKAKLEFPKRKVGGIDTGGDAVLIWDVSARCAMNGRQVTGS